MTNAQKWVAAFLGVFILLFVLSSIVKDDEIVIPEEIDSYAQEEPTGNVAEEVTGLSLIEQNGCLSCHGRNLEGMQNLGPSLYNAKAHWDRDELINYLRNPSDYSNDPRFDDYANQFRNIMMPSYDNLDVKDLGKIADYILSLEK